MAWVRLEDSFAEHPKVLSVSVQARWAYISALCYVNRRQTDGVIARVVLPSIGINPKLAQELVNARLWDQHGDDYMIHDFLEYNLSKAQQDERRDAKSRAGASGGRQSGVTRRSKNEADASARASDLLEQLASTTSSKDEAKTKPKPKPKIQTLSNESVSDTHPPDGELPVAVRELRDTVLMGLPAKFRYDSSTVEEAELLAQDFAGDGSVVITAINAIRRRSQIPWPNDIRREIKPPEKPKPAVAMFFDDPSVAPQWWRDQQARNGAAS